MRKLIFSLGFLCFLIAPGIAQDQDQQDRQGKKERLETMKIAHITKAIDLTSNQAEKFWPVYNRHQDEQKNLRKQFELRDRKKDMTDAEAEKKLDEWLSYKREELNLMENHMQELKTILSAKQIIRLQRAETQFRKRMVDEIKKNMKGQKGSRR